MKNSSEAVKILIILWSTSCLTAEGTYSSLLRKYKFRSALKKNNLGDGKNFSFRHLGLSLECWKLWVSQSWQKESIIILSLCLIFKSFKDCKSYGWRNTIQNSPTRETKDHWCFKWPGGWKFESHCSHNIKRGLLQFCRYNKLEPIRPWITCNHLCRSISLLLLVRSSVLTINDDFVIKLVQSGKRSFRPIPESAQFSQEGWRKRQKTM